MLDVGVLNEQSSWNSVRSSSLVEWGWTPLVAKVMWSSFSNSLWEPVRTPIQSCWVVIWPLARALVAWFLKSCALPVRSLRRRRRVRTGCRWWG